jgi:hypothetical protein
MTANDYTAWDSGCDRIFLDFDLWLMASVGFPQEVMDLYKYEKTHTVCHAGPMPIMQFSGDRYTWLLNTARNAALTGVSLDCPVGATACFSGDDSLLLGNFAPAKELKGLHYNMAPKPIRSRIGEFCGYQYGGSHLFVNPRAVLYRARINFEDGVVDPNVWDSIDYAARDAVVDGFAGEEVVMAEHLSRSARTYFGLPNSRFPLRSTKSPPPPAAGRYVIPARRPAATRRSKFR